MTLVFDQRANLQGKPGVHALIAGVSAYRHLPGGTGDPAPKTFGMQQLSSTALTAYAVYSWLLHRKDHLPLPLASVRLLLSPSPQEMASDAKLNAMSAQVERCLRANFQVQAVDWRQDANSHPDNVTFFYFAGHGVQRSKDDAVLLMEDFADKYGPGTLGNSVAVKNLFFGMATADAFPNIAQTQLYFVDACRVLPKEFKDNELMNVPDVFDVELNRPDTRRAPIFYAAVPGTRAYSLKCDQTLFSKALLKCLNESAAQPQDDPQGHIQWIVTVNSLNQVLDANFQVLNQTAFAEQDYALGGNAKNTTIHILDGPPPVDILLSIDPQEALPVTAVTVTDDQLRPVLNLPPPIIPQPYPQRLPAGLYTVQGELTAALPGLVPYKRVRQLLPTGGLDWKVRMKP